MNTKALSVLLVLLTALLGGCAGQIKLLPIKVADETGALRTAVLATTTTSDSLDRSASLTQVGIDTDLKDEQGKPIYRQVASSLDTGPTVGGDTIRGVTNGMGFGFLQYKAAVRTTELKSRAAPGGGITFNVQGSQALSGATAISESGANASGAMSTGVCPNCGGFPMK
jgi:hypothetical protein